MSRAGRLTPGDRAGNLIKMEPFFKTLNGEKIIIRFLHLHRGSIAVSRGNSANTGTPIAKVGRSGCVTGVHLHVDMRKGREYYETWSSLVDDVKAVKSAFVKVFDDDEKFLELFKRLVPEEYRGTYKAPTSEHKVIKDYITEMITAYGLGRVDPTKGGVGKMFKLGVDYELAGTNIPHVGQGYVDRVHSLPYEIIVKTDQDPRATYKTMFGKDMLTNFVHIVPDQVYYGKDGFKLSAHVSTGSNQGDEEDVELITNELYKFITSLPSTPDPSTFFITVYPVVDKIKYFV